MLCDDGDTSAKQAATNSGVFRKTMIPNRNTGNIPQLRVERVAIGSAIISVTLITTHFTLSARTQCKLGILSGKCRNRDSQLKRNLAKGKANIINQIQTNLKSTECVDGKELATTTNKKTPT